MAKKSYQEFEDLNVYRKIIYLFSKIREINYKLNQEPFFSFSDDERESKLIYYDTEKESFEEQIKNLLDGLYLFSHETNLYYFDCSFKVYQSHFNKRKEAFFEQNIDAEYLDFLKSEVEYFSDPKSNRVLEANYYNDYIEYENKYRISLNKKIAFLNAEFKQFNHIIRTIENTFIKDEMGNTVAYGTDLYLEKIENDTSNNVNMEREKSDTSFYGSKLKWIGKKAHLGFIIGTLADLGYIQGPERPNGEINYSEFARNVLDVFDCDTTEGTLSKYLNVTSDKSEEVLRNFKNSNFNIPHSKDVG